MKKSYENFHFFHSRDTQQTFIEAASFWFLFTD